MTDAVQSIPTGPEPEDLGFSSDRLERLSIWMRRYVDEGKLPFAEVLVARSGEVVFHQTVGNRDLASGTPAIPGGLLRIYSMTKPITTVAALTLFEEGALQLDDPVSKFLPEIGRMKVLDGDAMVDQATPMTIRQLMTHTSGLVYGQFDPGPVGAALRKARIDFSAKGETLADTVAKLADVPLAFQPGTRWQYGVSTDVLGRVVEVVAGKPLAEVLRERILGPLGMNDTSFSVPEGKLDRFCPCYTKTAEELMRHADGVADSRFAGKVVMASGGGGLVSSSLDYFRFMEMLRLGGELDGARVLGRKTVDLMFMNHLPDDIAAMGTPSFSEMPMTGIGFGLGGSILLDPARAQILGTPGEFAWGGVASTGFWIDPLEDLVAYFGTQLMPSSSYPLRREMRVLVYQAMVD
jgi:CubicO group peptidase (beta-lactamase class C family)